jgi:hypothetical protein
MSASIPAFFEVGLDRPELLPHLVPVRVQVVRLHAEHRLQQALVGADT